MNQHFFTLTDGRKLCYALYGTTDGKPVFYFHGTPGSRLEPLLLNAYNKNLDALLLQNHICLIAVDRPGAGLSTYHPHKSFQSFAGDVRQLAAHLHITKAAVSGWSGAGPYALSLAFHCPELITGVYLVTTFTRSFSEPGVFKIMHANKYYFGCARYAPWLLQKVLQVISKKPASKPLPKWLSGLPEADLNCMKTPGEMRQFSIVTICESCIAGSKGAVQEAAIYFDKTGYDLAHIQQSVHYWWGTEDNVVPMVHPKVIEEKAPHATMHYYKGEGHVSIYIRCFEEVLETIAKQ